MYNWQNIQKRIAHIENPIGAEIGVYQGVMSERLLANIPGLTLYMIDSWSRFTDETDENIKIKYCDNWKENYNCSLDIANRFKDRALIYRWPSLDAVKYFDDGELDFVYIDADHRYEAVKADILAWLPKVKKSGWLCGHDYGEKEGVTKAVDELFSGYKFASDNYFISDLKVEIDDDYTWFVRV